MLRLPIPWRSLLLFVPPLLLLVVLVGAWSALFRPSGEKWPSHTPNPGWKPLVDDALKLYSDQHISYKPYLQEYSPIGDFLNWGRILKWRESATVHLDADGIPMIKVGTEFFYNPVTVSQFCLALHGRYLDGKETLQRFVKCTDRLLAMQDSAGAFRYPYSWNYYLTGNDFPVGWVSAMAQGQALSVLARAYSLTGDKRYVEAGEKAFSFMQIPVAQGGTMDTLKDLDPSLSGYIFYEEYIAKPASYTLNGFMFTVLGIYDWSQTYAPSAGKAGERFAQCINTLKHILRYYDAGGMTIYDLGYLTYNTKPHIVAGYHDVHVYLLHAFYSITNDPDIKSIETKWASYVPK